VDPALFRVGTGGASGVSSSVDVTGLICWADFTGLLVLVPIARGHIDRVDSRAGDVETRVGGLAAGVTLVGLLKRGSVTSIGRRCGSGSVSGASAVFTGGTHVTRG